MRWSDIPFRPTAANPAPVCRAVDCVLSGTGVRGSGFTDQCPEWAAVLGIVAVTVGPAGLLRPSLIRPIYVGWMVLAFPVGWVPLTSCWPSCSTELSRRSDSSFAWQGTMPWPVGGCQSADSYWEPRPEPPAGGTYYRQF